MGNPVLALVPLAWIIALAVACSDNQTSSSLPPVITPQVQSPEEVTMDSKDESFSIGQHVRPHFYAHDEDGQLQEPRGELDRIVSWRGKSKVRLNSGGAHQYLDPLALQSGLIGEHPAQRLLRLHDSGVALDAELGDMLRSTTTASHLFQNLTFEYLPGKEASGTISDVFPDGTFLVILEETPEEWQSEQPNIASPTHLHVNPRALTVGQSQLAQEFEEEILSLSFDDQRYPPPPLARKQCGVYHESLTSSQYAGLLETIGYRFTVEHVAGDDTESPRPFGELLLSLFRRGAGEETNYFGHDRFWLADRLAELQVSWMAECDTAGALRSYRRQGANEDTYYLIVRRSLEPEKTQRYRVLSLADDGSAQEIYVAPGIVLMAMPLPSGDHRWLMSTEGWKSPDDEGPADPRWQTVHLVNLGDPEEYHKVKYPISQFPDAPEAGLYGVSPRLNADGRFLLNTLYGFKDEGGGIWVSDLSQEDYYNRPDQFVRIVAWDHTLSWMKLEREEDGPSPHFHLFMTGKEVADDFAMTANILRVRDAGLESSILYQERLLQMVGWNPVPFAVQRQSDTRFRVAVETHFNYESSLLPRAKGVYIIPVDLEGIAVKDQP
jgi:hypothetical protein